MRREAGQLRRVGRLAAGSVLRLPEIIHSGSWNELEVLVLRPLAGGMPLHHAGDNPLEASRALAACSTIRREELAASPFWQRTVAQLQTDWPASSKSLIARAVDGIGQRYGTTSLDVGLSHGDWIPPNMRRLADGSHAVWDWERAEDDVPVGIDSMQFLISSSSAHAGTRTGGRKAR